VDALLAIIADCAAAAATRVAVLEAALKEAHVGEAARLPSPSEHGRGGGGSEEVTPSDRSAMAAVKGAVMVAELEALQADVWARHGVTEKEVVAAYDYYTAGPGRDRRVVDAAASLRKSLGRHLLTKQKILALLKAMFLHQVRPPPSTVLPVTPSPLSERRRWAAPPRHATGIEPVQGCTAAHPAFGGRHELAGRGGDRGLVLVRVQACVGMCAHVCARRELAAD
jgi:hypothetical protein